MSIKIGFEYLTSGNNAVAIGGRVDFDNFNLLSTQIENLLLLQLRKKEKNRLKFSLEDKAMVILYEPIENSSQQKIDKTSEEDHLISALKERVKEMDTYLKYLAGGEQLTAINFNIAHKKLPSKMQAILCKLASEEVRLSTDSNLILELHKTEAFDGAREVQTTKAINCRITKPDLINNLTAEFHYSLDKKKYVATLDIASGYESKILQYALNRQEVDIEFEYTEKINQPRIYSGTLISFEVAIRPSMEVVTEDLF